NFSNIEPFKNTEVSKVVVHKLENTWTIYIKNDKPLDVELLSNLKNVCKSGFEEVKRIDLEIQNDTFDEEDVLSYIKYYLNFLSTKSPALKSLKGANIAVKDKTITIEVMNVVEKNLIKSKMDKILSWFEHMGLPGITIEMTINLEKRKKVKEEIANIKSTIEVPAKSVAYAEKAQPPVLEIKGSALFGVAFDDSKIVPIASITDEKRGVAICAYITELRAMESQRSEYKIFTIKVSDGTTPFTCKLFTTDASVYQFLLKNLKEGSWYKWRGSIQNDSFLHSLVLTVRSIMECDEREMKRPEIKIESEPAMPDYGDIPEYIPDEDSSNTFTDAAFFAFDDDVPTPEYDFVGIEDAIPETLKKEIPKKSDNRETRTPIKTEEGAILGANVNGLVMEMRNVTAPVSSCIFEAKIFDLDFFESSKN
ncbi:MAG TPA: hypothetical protein DCY94_02925, partial [Firmicutes bacterium]|nr:hypothetical protein [Bacillota bacterium]